MKTIFLFLFLAGNIFADELATNSFGWVFAPGSPAALRAHQSPLPLQAAICDIIGIGHVADVAESGRERITRIEVDNYWIGSPGTNTLFLVSHTNPPVNAEVPILFFASSYSFPDKGVSLSEARFEMAFRNAEFRQEEWKRSRPVFYDRERSWIPCIPENEAEIVFASNLVAAAQTTPNRTAFYEIIRDGHRLDAPSPRIWIDAETSFWNCRDWMDTNMMWQAWDDPQLDDGARNAVNNAFKSTTRSFFPRPPQFE